MFFFFNDTATTEIYTLSLHDALPISRTRPIRLATNSTAIASSAGQTAHRDRPARPARPVLGVTTNRPGDRKSTRLNSSHANISYAVFCLKKKKHNEPIKLSSPNQQSL